MASVHQVEEPDVSLPAVLKESSNLCHQWNPKHDDEQ